MHSSGSSGENTNTLQVPDLTYLYTSVCISPTPHTRSCQFQILCSKAYEVMPLLYHCYCSTRPMRQDCACRGDRNRHRPPASITHVRLNTFQHTHTQATYISVPAAMNRLRTFQHMHSGYELFSTCSDELSTSM